MEENLREIAKFSKKDAEVRLSRWPKNKFSPFQNTSTICNGLDKQLKGYSIESPLIGIRGVQQYKIYINFGSFIRLVSFSKRIRKAFLVKHVNFEDAKILQEVMFTSVAKVLDKWFENDIIKGTLSYDGVIGVPYGPYNEGTG